MLPANFLSLPWTKTPPPRPAVAHNLAMTSRYVKLEKKPGVGDVVYFWRLDKNNRCDSGKVETKEGSAVLQSLRASACSIIGVACVLSMLLPAAQACPPLDSRLCHRRLC